MENHAKIQKICHQQYEERKSEWNPDQAENMITNLKQSISTGHNINRTKNWNVYNVFLAFDIHLRSRTRASSYLRQFHKWPYILSIHRGVKLSFNSSHYCSSSSSSAPFTFMLTMLPTAHDLWQILTRRNWTFRSALSPTTCFLQFIWQSMAARTDDLDLGYATGGECLLWISENSWG